MLVGKRRRIEAFATFAVQFMFTDLSSGSTKLDASAKARAVVDPKVPIAAHITLLAQIEVLTAKDPQACVTRPTLNRPRSRRPLRRRRRPATAPKAPAHCPP